MSLISDGPEYSRSLCVILDGYLDRKSFVRRLRPERGARSMMFASAPKMDSIRCEATSPPPTMSTFLSWSRHAIKREPPPGSVIVWKWRGLTSAQRPTWSELQPCLRTSTRLAGSKVIFPSFARHVSIRHQCAQYQSHFFQVSAKIRSFEWLVSYPHASKLWSQISCPSPNKNLENHAEHATARSQSFVGIQVMALDTRRR